MATEPTTETTTPATTTTKKKKDDKQSSIAFIKPANYRRTTLRIVGTAPLVQNKFSKKAKDKMMQQMATSKAEKKSKKEREPRNFDDDFVQCQYRSVEGWNGLPCSAFRDAMIAACRTVGVVMTQAKMAVWLVADGRDAETKQPLVRLLAPPPERREDPVINDNGSADIRIRAMWEEWEANITIEFDADMITGDSVVNLLDRAGRQVGIGEGRPFSKKSPGCGWGTFRVVLGEQPEPPAPVEEEEAAA